MENHPIPQDITGFQFKIIGDMTIKQFAYIAGGVIAAWITFILPVFSIIKIPFVILFAGLGASLAFLPVEGRPFDLMVKNFFRAVFSPTQYVYQKDNGAQPNGQVSTFRPEPSIAELSQQQLKSFIGSLPGGKKNKLDEKETVFFQNLANYSANPQPVRPAPEVPKPHAFANAAPSPQQKINTADQQENPQIGLSDESLKNEALILEKELNEAKAKESMQAQVNSKEYLEAHQKVLELQQNLNETLFQKQELEKKLIDLQKQIQEKQETVYSPSLAQEPVQKETKFVRSIPQTMAKGAGLPIAPEFPNIITGIVKDPRGNPLPNILVEVKDAEDNAVRAFKTNALGQFASATPLVNGRYTISFEDPKGQNRFDSVAFDATGQIVLPIEVISVDTREELRRSLFN